MSFSATSWPWPVPDFPNDQTPMSREHGQLRYGERVIPYQIVRRARRTMEIAVEPDASVVIAAPIEASTETIVAKLRQRAAWVVQQQRYFAQFLPRTPPRRFVAGETHRYLGRQYRLKIVPHSQDCVKLLRGFIVVQTHHPHQHGIVQGLVEGWYGHCAQVKFTQRIAMCRQRFPEPDTFRPHGLIIRQSRQRWGSMSPAGRLFLNRRLIEAPVVAIDCVITHELCHMAEPHHGAAFFKLLARVMPDWAQRKQRLEQFMA